MKNDLKNTHDESRHVTKFKDFQIEKHKQIQSIYFTMQYENGRERERQKKMKRYENYQQKAAIHNG